MRAACTLQVQLRRRASSTGLTGDALRSHEASRKTVAGVKFVKVGVTSSSHAALEEMSEEAVFAENFERVAELGAQLEGNADRKAAAGAALAALVETW